MNKLRLLFNTQCNRSCAGCCNKDWNLGELPEVEHFNYDIIMITGGEPLLEPERLIGLVQAIRVVSRAQIYLYTAMTVHQRSFKLIYDVMRYIDGVTITLHTQYDVAGLKHVIYSIQNDVKTRAVFYKKSVKINIFEGIDEESISYPPMWDIKRNITWIKNCPLPDGEVFKRLPLLK